MRLIICALSLVCILGIFQAPKAFSQKSSPPKSRSESVLNTFAVMCNLRAPDFDYLSAKATAMRMRLMEDNKKAPSAQNTVSRSKSWVGLLTTGPFIFQIAEMSGAKGTTTSCAVVAEVPDVDVFRAGVMEDFHLDKAPAPEISTNGSRSYYWDHPTNPNDDIVVRDFKPAGKHGVMVKILVKR